MRLACRAKPAGYLQTISGLAMTFGGIIGSISGGLGLGALNVEGILLLLSLFPLVQLLACGMIDDKTLGQAAMSTDEGSCNIHEDDDGEILNIDMPKTINLVADYFGMVSFLDDKDEYLDSMKLRGFSQNRPVYYNDAVATVRLPWTHDLDPGEFKNVSDSRVVHKPSLQAVAAPYAHVHLHLMTPNLSLHNKSIAKYVCCIDINSPTYYHHQRMTTCQTANHGSIGIRFDRCSLG